MVIVFLGPQGSGKGTQAERLSKKLRIPTYSAGQLYRDEVKKDTALGREAKKIMEQGLFMPSETTNRLMKKYLTPARCRRGVILDGYPRAVAQVHANDKFCKPDLVFYIKLTDTEAVRRLSLRRVCTKCQTNFHLQFAPPARDGHCRRCGGKLARRTDDSPTAIRKRLRHFHREVMPAIRLYEQRGIMREINGAQTIEKVAQDIWTSLPKPSKKSR